MDGNEIGTLWVLMERRGDPWDADPVIVKILDVKAGWVRYQMGSGSRLPLDNRMRVAEFLKFYQRVLKESDWPEEIDVQLDD